MRPRPRFRATRREILKAGIVGGAAMMLPWRLSPFGVQRAFAQIGGGTLPPGDVPKYVNPLVKPPVFPRAGKINRQGLKNAEYYEIATRQFQQQILPGASPGFAGLPATTVWSYGPANATARLGRAKPALGSQADPHQHQHHRHLDQHADHGRQGRAGGEAEEHDRGGDRHLEVVRGADHRRRRGVLVARASGVLASP